MSHWRQEVVGWGKGRSVLLPTWATTLVRSNSLSVLTGKKARKILAQSYTTETDKVLSWNRIIPSHIRSQNKRLSPGKPWAITQCFDNAFGCCSGNRHILWPRVALTTRSRATRRTVSDVSPYSKPFSKRNFISRPRDFETEILLFFSERSLKRGGAVFSTFAPLPQSHICHSTIVLVAQSMTGKQKFDQFNLHVAG